MAKAIIARIRKFLESRPGYAWLLVFVSGAAFWACVVLLVVGCASNGERVTDFWGARWFYKCELPQYWIDRTLRVYDIQVLPWKEFNKVAWGHGINPDPARAFISGTSIYLREDYSLDNLYHEIAHSLDQWNGILGDHPVACWANSKPWGYDDRVRTAFQGADLPRGVGL